MKGKVVVRVVMAESGGVGRRTGQTSTFAEVVVVVVDKNMLGDMGEVWDRCPCREGSELSCDGGVRVEEGGDTRAQVGGHGHPDQDDGVVGDGARGGVTDGGMDDCFVWDDVNGVGSEVEEYVGVLQGDVQGGLQGVVPEDHGDVQEVVQGDEEVLLSDVQGMQGAFDC